MHKNPDTMFTFVFPAAIAKRVPIISGFLTESVSVQSHFAESYDIPYVLCSCCDPAPQVFIVLRGLLNPRYDR